MAITSSFQIQMFRMSDGKPYPNDARAAVMECSYDAQTRVGRADLELTSCRILASVLTRPIGESLERGDIFVWDWRTGKVYLVSHSIFSLGTNLIGPLKARPNTSHNHPFYR